MNHPLLPEVSKEMQKVLSTGNPVLAPIVRYLLDTQGKGTRPLLVLLTGDIVSAPVQNSVRMAVAVELLHMASLVHDDIVDQSDLRRSRAAIHKQWGEGAAVLLGDYLFGKMLNVISSYPSIISCFADVIQNLVDGEFMQASQLHNPWLTEEEYLRRISLKTATFIAACCKVSSLAEGRQDLTEALGNFGHSLGMAYQLLDDLQDFLESPSALGKPVRQDLTNGIYTLPYLRSIPYTQSLATHYIQKSISSLSGLPPSRAKAGLIRFALNIKKKIDQLQEGILHVPSID
ncbi:polyprenyl synthetase family protein [Effusibacillus lacus]|uniref:Heptaprenyl diphosphate synthase n=1 Tax=Effusibacillus lacus TaxID=1348429 RepID=A0A292YJP4_9BACL|nr:polyprenyl synthetase family protein [Effusibacillus lacus]TCS74411.1 heptaprenyl diphosphate synthase [Effusibacillus lacus]GAX88715.1 hypothetical protein EFBL_0329 [Effusibacillus lacus]